MASAYCMFNGSIHYNFAADVGSIIGPLQRTVSDIVICCLMQILEALKASHRSGIVHRDVKPQNVIISETDNRVKFIDLGAAADLRVGINYVPNEYLLDPRYAPPQQYIMSTQVSLHSSAINRHQFIQVVIHLAALSLKAAACFSLEQSRHFNLPSTALHADMSRRNRLSLLNTFVASIAFCRWCVCIHLCPSIDLSHLRCAIVDADP